MDNLESSTLARDVDQEISKRRLLLVDLLANADAAEKTAALDRFDRLIFIDKNQRSEATNRYLQKLIASGLSSAERAPFLREQNKQWREHSHCKIRELFLSIPSIAASCYPAAADPDCIAWDAALAEEMKARMTSLATHKASLDAKGLTMAAKQTAMQEYSHQLRVASEAIGLSKLKKTALAVGQPLGKEQMEMLALTSETHLQAANDFRQEQLARLRDSLVRQGVDLLEVEQKLVDYERSLRVFGLRDHNQSVLLPVVERTKDWRVAPGCPTLNEYEAADKRAALNAAVQEFALKQSSSDPASLKKSVLNHQLSLLTQADTLASAEIRTAFGRVVLNDSKKLQEFDQQFALVQSRKAVQMTLQVDTLCNDSTKSLAAVLKDVNAFHAAWRKHEFSQFVDRVVVEAPNKCVSPVANPQLAVFMATVNSQMAANKSSSASYSSQLKNSGLGGEQFALAMARFDAKTRADLHTLTQSILLNYFNTLPGSSEALSSLKEFVQMSSVRTALVASNVEAFVTLQKKINVAPDVMANKVQNYESDCLKDIFVEFLELVVVLFSKTNVRMPAPNVMTALEISQRYRDEMMNASKAVATRKTQLTGDILVMTEELLDFVSSSADGPLMSSLAAQRAMLVTLVVNQIRAVEYLAQHDAEVKDIVASRTTARTVLRASLAGSSMNLDQKVAVMTEFDAIWFDHSLRCYLITIHLISSQIFGVDGLPLSPMMMEYKRDLSDYENSTKATLEAAIKMMTDSKSPPSVIQAAISKQFDGIRTSRDELEMKSQIQCVTKNSILLDREESEAYLMDASSSITTMLQQRERALFQYRESLVNNASIDLASWIAHELAHEVKLRTLSMKQLEVFVLGLRKRCKLLVPLPILETPRDLNKRVGSEMNLRVRTLADLEVKLIKYCSLSYETEKSLRESFTSMCGRGSTYETEMQKKAMEQLFATADMATKAAKMQQFETFSSHEYRAQKDALSLYLWRLGLSSSSVIGQASKLSEYESEWRLHSHYKFLQMLREIAPSDVPRPLSPAMTMYEVQLQEELKKRQLDLNGVADRDSKSIELLEASSNMEVEYQTKAIRLLLTRQNESDVVGIVSSFSEKIKLAVYTRSSLLKDFRAKLAKRGDAPAVVDQKAINYEISLRKEGYRQYLAFAEKATTSMYLSMVPCSGVPSMLEFKTVLDAEATRRTQQVATQERELKEANLSTVDLEQAVESYVGRLDATQASKEDKQYFEAISALFAKINAQNKLQDYTNLMTLLKSRQGQALLDYRARLLAGKTPFLARMALIADYSRNWRVYVLERLTEFLFDVAPSTNLAAPDPYIVDFEAMLSADMKRRKMVLKAHEQSELKSNSDVDRIQASCAIYEVQLRQQEEEKLLTLQKQELSVYLGHLSPEERDTTMEQVLTQLNSGIANRRDALESLHKKLNNAGVTGDAYTSKIRKAERSRRVDNHLKYLAYMNGLRASQKHVPIFADFPLFAVIEQKLMVESKQRLDVITNFEKQLSENNLSFKQKIDQIVLLEDQMSKQFGTGDRDLQQSFAARLFQDHATEVLKEFMNKYDMEVAQPGAKRRAEALNKYRTRLATINEVIEREDRLCAFEFALRKVGWENFYYYLRLHAPVKKLLNALEKPASFYYQFMFNSDIAARTLRSSQYKIQLAANYPGVDTRPYYTTYIRDIRRQSEDSELKMHLAELKAWCVALSIDQEESITADRYEVMTQELEKRVEDVDSFESKLYLREGYSAESESKIARYELSLRKDSYKKFLATVEPLREKEHAKAFASVLGLPELMAAMNAEHTQRVDALIKYAESMAENNLSKEKQEKNLFEYDLQLSQTLDKQDFDRQAAIAARFGGVLASTLADLIRSESQTLQAARMAAIHVYSQECSAVGLSPLEKITKISEASHQWREFALNRFFINIQRMNPRKTEDEAADPRMQSYLKRLEVELKQRFESFEVYRTQCVANRVPEDAMGPALEKYYAQLRTAAHSQELPFLNDLLKPHLAYLGSKEAEDAAAAKARETVEQTLSEMSASLDSLYESLS